MLNLQTGVVISFALSYADTGGTTGRQLACFQEALIYSRGSSRTPSGGENALAGVFSVCTVNGFKAAGSGEESRLQAAALPGENSFSHAHCFKTGRAQCILTVRRQGL